MAVLMKSDKALIYADHIKSYLKDKSPDCILYSQDGYEFQIHKVRNTLQTFQLPQFSTSVSHIISTFSLTVYVYYVQ